MKYQYFIPENSALLRIFQEKHPHLAHWYQTKQGQKYLEQQYERIQEEDLGERMISLNDIGIPLSFEHFNTFDESELTEMVIRRVQEQ